jgi:hypothetical protein
MSKEYKMKDFYITTDSFADGTLMLFRFHKDLHVQFQGLRLVKTQYFKKYFTDIGFVLLYSTT